MSSWLLALQLLLGDVTPVSPEPDSPPSPRSEVIVMVRGGPQAATEVLTSLPANSFEVTRKYARLGGFAGRATNEALRRLQVDARVSSLEPERFGHPMLAESSVVIGAVEAHTAMGLSGFGVTVAVLDTGVDAKHPNLDGGVVAQQCFTYASCPPDKADSGSLAPEGDGHGTHVSSIIAGNGTFGAAGIAPEAKLVVIRVFNDQAVGRVSDWVAALDWVLVNRELLGVRLVNLSLGTNDVYSTACDEQQPAMSAAVASLRDAGVTVFAASGNDGRSEAMSAPACIAAVVAVGATYDAPFARQPSSGSYAAGCADVDAGPTTIACFSNASSQLDLLAPGARIKASVPGGLAEKNGTSQATPHATGAAALLLQFDDSLTPEQLETTLKQSGHPILDSRNNLTFPLIDVVSATTSLQTTWCARHEEGAACPVTLRCDGGLCARTGVCIAGSCDVVLPAVGALPAAGCNGFVGVASLMAMAVIVRRRRTP